MAAVERNAKMSAMAGRRRQTRTLSRRTQAASNAIWANSGDELDMMSPKAVEKSSGVAWNSGGMLTLRRSMRNMRFGWGTERTDDDGGDVEGWEDKKEEEDAA